MTALARRIALTMAESVVTRTLLHRVSRIRKAADVVDRQRLPAELRVALVHLHLGEQQADRFGRAGDGVDAVPRPRRMARRALHRHEYVDAAAVAERDLETGPAQHRHVRAHTRALDHAFDRVV